MWRWSVEHSATPASLQQPATTCAQTVKYSAKRNAHGSTPSYVDRDSLTQSGTSSLFALLGKVRWWRQDNAVLVSVEAYYYQRFVDALGVNRIILQEGILPKPIAARSEVQCIASDGNWSRLIVTTIDSAGSLTWTPRSTELAVAANEKIRFQMQYVAA